MSEKSPEAMIVVLVAAGVLFAIEVGLSLGLAFGTDVSKSMIVADETPEVHPSYTAPAKAVGSR